MRTTNALHTPCTSSLVVNVLACLPRWRCALVNHITGTQDLGTGRAPIARVYRYHVKPEPKLVDMVSRRVVQRNSKSLLVALRRQPEASHDRADFFRLNFPPFATAHQDRIDCKRDLPYVKLCLLLVAMVEQGFDHNRADIRPAPCLGVVLIL